MSANANWLSLVLPNGTEVHAALMDCRGLAYCLEIASPALEADEREREAVGIIARLINNRIDDVLKVLEAEMAKSVA